MRKKYDFEIPQKVLESYFPKGTSLENPAVFDPNVCNTERLLHYFDVRTNRSYRGSMNGGLPFNGVNLDIVHSLAVSKSNEPNIRHYMYTWYKNGRLQRASDKPTSIFYDGTTLRFTWGAETFAASRKYKPATVTYHNGKLIDYMWYYNGSRTLVTIDWFHENGINVNKMSVQDKIFFDMAWGYK